MAEYVTSHASLAALSLEWLAADGSVIDFASGWVFTVTIGRGGEAVVTKTSGITGAATSPNIVVTWGPRELAALGAGEYSIQIVALNVSTGRERIYTEAFSIEDLPLS